MLQHTGPQEPNGSIELQSAGLPLPDLPLRWLASLNRPLLRHDPKPGTQFSPAADTIMQDAALSDVASVPQDFAVPPVQTDTRQQHAQQAQSMSSQQQDQQQQPHHQSAIAAGTVWQQMPEDAAGAAPMQVVDTQPTQSPALLLTPTTSSKPEGVAALAEVVPQVQSIQMPEGLQGTVSARVARCDRQLLGRQEQVMVSLIQQRVAEEVRQVQGAQDMDHPADQLVQKVWMGFASVLLPITSVTVCPAAFHVSSADSTSI